MGVKNFQKFINLYCPESIKYICKKDLYGKRVGIDGNFWLYQIMASLKSNDISVFNQRNQNITHIYGLYLRINSILRMNIKPVFVFDGKPPTLKYDSLQQRKQQKLISRKKLEDNSFSNEHQKKKLIQSSFFISQREISDCKLLLHHMNIPYIQSVQESDSQLAWLKKNNYIDFIISNDFDILMFGGNFLLPYFKSSNKYFKLIDFDILKNHLRLSDVDLINISILLGNDYTKTHHTEITVDNVLHFIKSSSLDDVNTKDIINYYQHPLITNDINLNDQSFYNDIDIYNMELN